MAKQQVAIVVDSTATLDEEQIQKYGIHVIPQCLNWQGKSYQDGVDITPTEFYKKLASESELPTTSQPSAGEFYEFFQKVAKTSESIVAVLISEQLSGTIASANAAREMMDEFPIEIVNSKSVAMGLGFMALAAARAAERGLNYLDVAQAARELVPKMRILFIVDTLEYLHKGGRIGGASRLLGTALSIKPILQIEDGRIETLMKVRTKRKAIDQALTILEEDMSDKADVQIAVIHAANEDEGARVLEEVKRRLNPTFGILTELTPVVGTHSGPGVVGLVYYAGDE